MFDISRTESVCIPDTNDIAPQEATIGRAPRVCPKRTIESTDICTLIARASFHLETKSVGSIRAEFTLEIFHFIERRCIDTHVIEGVIKVE